MPNNEVRGYVVLWGDAEHHDLDGEYFTPQTDFGFGERQHVPIKNYVPGDLLGEIIGEADVVKDERGLWMDGVFDPVKLRQYAAAMLRLRDEKYLHMSIGTELGATIVVGDNGEIKVWIPTEVGITIMPADPRLPPVEGGEA